MAALDVVLDTSVLIAAARSVFGASSRLLELLAQQRYGNHLSVPLVLEDEAVLRREVNIDGLGLTDVATVLKYLCNVGVLHPIPFLWRPTLRDPDDEVVLELAMAAGVDYLVTHNVRDFVGSEAFGVKVLKPGESWQSGEVPGGAA